MDKKHKPFAIIVSALLWVAMTFIVVRFAIPALVNAHNDGALIGAGVLATAYVVMSYLLYRLMEDFWNE